MEPHVASAKLRGGFAVPGWRWVLLPVLVLPVALSGWLLSQGPAALAGQPWRLGIDWLPALGLRLELQLDSLSLIFALLVTGIGALVVAYSIPYMAGEYGLGRYYGSLLFFMLAMLGAILAGNLLVLFICWELTSISSYLLISFHHEDERSQKSALQALLITSAGGLAMLAGFALIGQVYGTFELAAILARPGLLQGHPYYPWALGLILLGAFTKSAQFPFHIWLPNAMVAPTPVSAYLHSATMVKAGLYLLARLSPILGGTAEWQVILVATGLLTMLLGAGRALLRRDLKAILAYTTISTLGAVVALLGLGIAEAVQAALTLVIAHALYKGALFLVAGIIDHETGTRDVGLLGGLWPYLSALAAVSLLAALSMAGLPPTAGFLAKELGYAAILGKPPSAGLNGPLALLFLAANACNVALAVVLGYRIFFRPAGGSWPHKPHGASWLLLLPPATLAGFSWLAGLSPALLDGAVGAAVTRVQPAGHAHPLQLWHGWGWPLLLSAATLGVGGLLYAAWPRLQSAGARPLLPLSVGRAYDWLVQVGLPRPATGLIRILQNGSLRTYVMIILAVTVLLVGGALLESRLLAHTIVEQEEFRWPEPVMAALLAAAALSVVLARTRLGAIISLGVVGALVTLFYVRFRAPDLALTQLLIESLTVILLLLVFHFLPPEFQARGSWRQTTLEVVIAVAMGALAAALVLLANGIRLGPFIADYYLAHSLPLAHGRNVVNVIVVDFRGFDTLGETTVLAAAALGLYALLQLRNKKR